MLQSRSRRKRHQIARRLYVCRLTGPIRNLHISAVGREMRQCCEMMRDTANVSPTFVRLTSSCLLDRKVLPTTVFLHSCRCRSCPGGDSNERGRPASTVQSTAIVAPDHRLLNKKWATFWAYDRHRGWTALEKDCTRLQIPPTAFTNAFGEPPLYSKYSTPRPRNGQQRASLRQRQHCLSALFRAGSRLEGSS